MFEFIAKDWCRQCRDLIADAEEKPASLCMTCGEQTFARQPIIDFLSDKNGDTTICVTAFPYEEPIKRMVLRLKYNTDLMIARDFGILLQPAWWKLCEYLPETPYVVPVPLHWLRRVTRGFNQAERIAYWLCYDLGLECKPHLLRRRRKTIAHHGLTRIQRMTNVRDAFTARPPEGAMRPVVQPTLRGESHGILNT